MNSPKRPIITCASSERLTPSHACQSPETAFFRGPCRPSPLQQQRQQHQNILFPLLRFTRVHQPAGSYRADLCGPINLHVGNILFYMIKMRKDRTKRKNTMHERFTKYKVFRKKTGISSFCCASSRESGHFLLSSVSPNGFTMTVTQ